MKPKITVLASLLVPALVLNMVQGKMWCNDQVYIDGCPRSTMDEKVQGIPWGQSWEDNCAACGRKFESAGLISKGWYCQQDRFSTGIWLKGCSTELGSCPRQSCGNQLYVASPANNHMYEKVQGIPWGQSWEDNCAACGRAFEQAGSLTQGWRCAKDWFGIYLTGKLTLSC